VGQKAQRGGPGYPLPGNTGQFRFLTCPNPPAWVRTLQSRIDCMGKRNQMTIKVSYSSIQKTAKICALIDSGATENFLDE
jgi:hypothetical protein